MSFKIPLSQPDHPNNPAAIVSTLREIVLSGRWTEGEYASSFEQEVAQYCGTIYAVASSSGTSALEQIFKSFSFNEGDEIILPSYSFVSTVNAVLSVRAKPVFADIDLGTYNLDLNDVQQRVTSKTKAILLVHQFGIPAHAVDFLDFCQQRNLLLIEDSASGLGSKFHQKSVGTFGIAGFLSFHPRKVLSSGEGGMIITDDEKLAERARMWSGPGQKSAGHNFRMSEFQAALGLWALENLSEGMKRRIKIAKNYYESLSQIDGVEVIRPPKDTEWNCQSYPIRVLGERRNLVVEELRKVGIESSFGPLPLHMHPFIEHRFHPPRISVTEWAHHNTLLLPIYSAMSLDEQSQVIDSLVSILKRI